MRILIIVENLGVPFDRRVWSEATTLRDAGHAVSIICPGDTSGYELLEGIHIYRHPLYQAKGTLGYLFEYAQALSWETFLAWRIHFTRGFDVIHLCNPPDLLFLVAAPFKWLGKKVVFDHHDLSLELYDAKFGRVDWLYRILAWCEKQTFRLADLVISTNESYREIAIIRGRKGTKEVVVVRSGPNLDRVKPVTPNSMWRWGRAYLVAYVGVIGHQEGIDLLLRSAAHIIETRGRKDITFIVMGAGPQLADMRKLSTFLGLDDYVLFMGRVDDETLFEVLSTADVCVNPDRPNEMNDKSTMNKIMEYMALGKPIVQYDLTEGRVSAQAASLYAKDPFDFGNKIIDLIDNPEARAAMGAHGQQRVREELSWEHEAPKLIAAYQRLEEPCQTIPSTSNASRPKANSCRSSRG